MKKLIDTFLQDDSFTVKFAAELRNELDSEMAKENPDLDLVNELVLSIGEMENLPVTEIDIDREYKKILRNDVNKPVLCRLRAFFIAACAMIFISNIISYSAYGESVCALITKKGDKITFNFHNSGKSHEYSFEYDSYGVKRTFEDLGLKVESPMYFPKGFEITEYHLDEDFVTLSDGVGQVNVSFMKFGAGVTVDGINPIEHSICVNGHPGTYISDENAYWLIYQFNEIVAIYDFQNLNREEIDKIIASIE